MYSYGAYGMHIISAFPLLLPSWDGLSRLNLHIVKGSCTPMHKGDTYTFGSIKYWIDDANDYISVEMGPVLRASVTQKAVIVVDGADHVSEQLLSSGIISILMVMWVKMHGFHTFHGSAVCSNYDRGVIILGSHGSGKSTTAANLTRHGFRFLCDDIVPVSMVNGVPTISSAVSWAKLLPEALHLFGLEEHDVAHQFDGFDKYAVPVLSTQRTVSLSACFVIEKEMHKSPFFSAEQVYGSKKLKLLCDHRAQLMGLDSPIAQFSFLSGALAHVPLWKIVRDNQSFSIEKVGNTIRAIIDAMDDFVVVSSK